MGAPRYLHGFSETEQQRLLAQADFLAPWVYGELELPGAGTLLEIGAGVGGQTRHLLARSGAQIIALEYAQAQVETLARVLAGPIAEGRVKPIRADGRSMPLPDRSADAAFICWVLEHVAGPGEVLREARRVLRPGGELVVTEVQNRSLTLLPDDPELGRFWSAVNDTQLALGGDPYVGARLGGMLQAQGYADIRIRFVPVHGDARDPRRRQQILEYFQRLLHSAVPTVASHLGGSEASWRAVVDGAFERALAQPDAVFLYTFAQATARAPE